MCAVQAAVADVRVTLKERDATSDSEVSSSTTLKLLYTFS